MNDSRIDARTAERMLRGEPAGPSEVAGLLAAAAARAPWSAPAEDERAREEAAVAAFRDARSGPVLRRTGTPLLRWATVRTALIAFLLLVAGGVAAATTSQHLPGPFGDRHVHSPGPPAPRTVAPAPAVPRHDGAHPQSSRHANHPAKRAHPAQGRKGKPKKNPHTPRMAPTSKAHPPQQVLPHGPGTTSWRRTG